MINRKKSSCAALFTLVCLMGILFSVLSLSVIFFINLRTLSNKQIQTVVHEQIAHLRDQVTYSLQQHTDLLHHAAAAIASILKYGGYVPFQEMRGILDRIAATDANVSLLFFSSNYPWNKEGGYYINDAWVPPDDWDNTKRPWFINAKAAAGKISYNDPYLDSNTGNLGSTLSTIVYDEEHNDIGVVAAGIWVTDWIKLFEENVKTRGQQLFLLNREGLFITNPDLSLVMTANFFTEFNLEHYRNEILSSTSFSKMDKDVFVYSSVMAQTNWILISVIPVSEIFTETNQLLFRLFLVIIGFLIAAGVISVLFTHTMLTVPIRVIEQVAGKLAQMDFTVDIKKFRTDELGGIQRALIQIRDSLKQGIDDIHRRHLAKAMESGRRLNTVVAESFDAIELIAQNTDKVDTKAKTQMESVAVAADSVTKIVEHTDSFKQTVHNQVDSIARSSSAIEEMVANIDSIRSVVAGTTKTADTLGKSSETGHRMLLKLTEELKNIEEQSATLQSANKTIADIAGQTNILAMNAAIEAAHAGESGKGFAVVAGEVRKLAELAGKESEAISAEIKKMEQAIARIGAVSEKTVGAMDMIFREISAMSSSFAVVSRAVEEQAAGGAQILSALNSVHGMTEEVREGAGFIHEQSGTIQTEIEKLQKISQEVSATLYEMRLAGRSISSFLESAKELAQSEFALNSSQ